MAARGGHTVAIGRFTRDEKVCYRVELFGKHGVGRAMIIDAATWQAGRAAGWPAVFTVQPEPKSGRFYVISCRCPLSIRGNAATLARIIMGAAKDEVVVYINGDTLDLRRGNLRKLTAYEASVARGRVMADQKFAIRIDVEDIKDIADPLETPVSELLPWEA